MKIGIALNMPADPPRSDADVIAEHLALGDLAEPLGFDSLFALEHHFSDYVLSPDPVQLLTYFAGRTRRIELGTAVAVLPLQQPVRLAEQIALLDVLTQGRCTFAFGRGSAGTEFQGLGIPLSESRGRFHEAAHILHGLLSQRTFQYAGNHFVVPPLSLRPVPRSQPQKRFYGAARSAESIQLVAQLGFGLQVSTQKDWAELSVDIEAYHAAARASGQPFRAPIVLAMVSVARTRQTAVARALAYLERDLVLAENHYGPTRGAVVLSRATQLNEILGRQIVGTPAECVEQISRLQAQTGLDHLLLEFSYGRMPFIEANNNIRLFASEVLPHFAVQPADATGTRAILAGGPA